MKWAIIITAVIIIGIALVPIVVTRIESYQAREAGKFQFKNVRGNLEIEPIAVVYFSRSGTDHQCDEIISLFGHQTLWRTSP